MSPEELFHKYEHLAPATTLKLFKNPIAIAKKFGIELEDIHQIAYIALWKASLSYKSEKGGNFQSFAITRIRWELLEKVNRDYNVISGITEKAIEFRKNIRYVSFDDKPSNSPKDGISVTNHEIYGDEYNLEGNVIGNMLEEMIGEQFPHRTVAALKRKMEGKSNREIGKELGVSREMIRLDLVKLKNKLAGVM